MCVCVCVCVCVRASALFSRYFVTRRFFNLRICCNTGELSAISFKKKVQIYVNSLKILYINCSHHKGIFQEEKIGL